MKWIEERDRTRKQGKERRREQNKGIGGRNGRDNWNEKKNKYGKDERIVGRMPIIWLISAWNLFIHFFTFYTFLYIYNLKIID